MTMNFNLTISMISALCLGAVTGSPVAASEHAPTLEATKARLAELIASDARPARHKARDQYRHPYETLTFCGVQSDMHVVEIWPGGQGGWYRRIIEPLIEEGGGLYFPVLERDAFPGKMEDIPYGQVDMVFVFRSHGFMIYDEPAQKHVDAVFEMLAPGGVFCIVDHAGDESIPQDPDGENGYVNESHFRELADKAGFTFLESSDINRNPKDTKDYPRGVYSLPPTLSRSLPGMPDRKKYIEIGESDRFTHKYDKPE